MANNNAPMLTGTDGLRAPTLADEPRRPYSGGTTPDKGISPYNPAPRPPAKSAPINVPRNFSFIRTATLGAPHVGLPDARRTSGHLQPSGEAWGSWHDSPKRTAPLPLAPPA